MTDQR